VEINGIGETVAESIADYFSDEKNLAVINKLLELGIKIKAPAPIAVSVEEKKRYLLSGKTFVVTGTLSAMSREEAREKIRLLGGHPTNSISSKTNYLIAGENPGSKFKKAKKLGVRIIDEKEFLGVINSSLEREK